MLVQQLVNGLMGSGIYALFAIGFTLTFGIMRVLNMAHADMAMVAVFALIWAIATGMGAVLAVLLAVVVVILLALLIERTAMRPGRRFDGDAALEMPLIATIGAGMILQNAAALLFGNKASLFSLRLGNFVHIGGMLVSQGLIVSAVTALILLALLEILVHRTGFGRQIRAVAQNRDAALIMGIDANLIIMQVVALSAVLAGAAGLMIGLTYGLVDPRMGIPYAVKGLVAMIVGGVGSLRGAVLGAILIAVTEALALTYLGSQLRDLGVFVVLVAVLAFRPAGLFATSQAK